MLAPRSWHVGIGEVALAVFLCCVQASVAESSLSEREAVERAMRNHPRLAAMREAIAAFEANEVQARQRPNPELSLEVEEVRFSDGPDVRSVATDAGGSVIERSIESTDNGGFRGSEITVSVSQRIELGRKRAKRIALADRATQVALWDYEVARTDIIAATREAFVEVLVGQERVALRRQLADVARAASSIVRNRVEGGKVSPLHGDRADIAYAQARIALTVAERELAASRASLAAQWGTAGPDFDSVRGSLAAVPSLPSLAELDEAYEKNPDLARWTAEVSRRDHAVRVERALGVPDLTVSAGWRNAGLADSSAARFDAGGALSGRNRSDFEDGRENSLVVGLSIPLPLFDRNQGRILEAEHRARQASHQRRAFRARLTGELVGLHERLLGRSEEIRTLEKEIVPRAQDTYEATKEGFEQGKFQYLSVLDAQRTLFEVRNQYIEALAAYHLGVVELERSLGSAIEEFASGTSEEGDAL